MYKNIEGLYKKKSPYNIIKKWTFWIYVVFILILLIFNILNKIVPMILVLIATVLIMKLMFEKTLKTKLHFSIGKTNENEIPLTLIIRNEEKELFKNYSIKNNLYNEKSLLCIIEHYRNMIKTKFVGGNLLAILSIIIPIALSFCTKEGFDFKGLANALPYLISFAIVIIELYFLYGKVIEIQQFLKGEDGMNERLEEIFSEIYIDCINENTTCKKKIKLLTYSLSEECCEKEFFKRLTTIYDFEFNGQTKISELYTFLLEKLDMKYAIDSYIGYRFSFKVGNERIHANVDFKLIEFLELHDLSKNENIELYFNECIGGGNGAYIEELAHIRINPSETPHKGTPHVHVYKNNSKKYVRIVLKTLEPMKNDNYKMNDIFTKKEQKQVLGIIEQHKEELKKFYEAIQRGEKPQEFIIEHNGKLIQFK